MCENTWRNSKSSSSPAGVAVVKVAAAMEGIDVAIDSEGMSHREEEIVRTTFLKPDRRSTMPHLGLDIEKA